MAENAQCTCEFEVMKQRRKYLKLMRNVPKEFWHISSYWKLCGSEEPHQIVKPKYTVSEDN